MKVATSFWPTSRNTHAYTMSIAHRKIAESGIEDLEQIATNLELGMRSNALNKGDAQHLLNKVRRAIADRHFQ